MKRKIRITVLMLALVLAGCSVIPKPQETTVQTSAPTQESTEATTKEPEAIAPFPGSAESSSPESEEASEEENPEYEKVIMIGTDIHYLSSKLTDHGSGFEYMIEHGDGRAVMYMDQITDAFFSEVVQKNPNLLILSGDLSFNGEKLSHQELAAKLKIVEAAGIPVLVIPGNHDINSIHAAGYEGESRYPVEITSPDEFRKIYGKFGYDEAVSSDEHSLSYVYQLDHYNRILMIDSCQYEGYGKVGGAIKTETYEWINRELEAAWNEGMNVIPVAHHNLLDESEIYVADCTIEHSEELIRILEGWDVPLFLSGHLHVQHMKKDDDTDGIQEIVTGSLTTPRCQYGILKFRDDASYEYHTVQVDVEAWSKKNSIKEEDLMKFNTFREPFLKRVFYNQAYDALEKMNLTATELKLMCEFYSELNFYYYQGTAITVKDRMMKEAGYLLWLEKGISSQLYDYIDYILEDATQNYNSISQE